MSAPTSPPEAPPSRGPDLVVWWRVGLVLLVLALAVIIPVTGERDTPYRDLVDALEAGDVAAVTVSPGLPDGSEGFATRQIRWQDGWISRETDVVEASDGTDTSDSDGPVVGPDAVQALRAAAPDLRVSDSREDLGGWSGMGWTTPGWVAVLVIGAAAFTIGLIVAGPKPWRATRWAWFWLVGSPIGFVLFLVFAGPFPMRRELQPERKFTGGWAFLLSIGLGAALPWS